MTISGLFFFPGLVSVSLSQQVFLSPSLVCLVPVKPSAFPRRAPLPSSGRAFADTSVSEPSDPRGQEQSPLPSPSTRGDLRLRGAGPALAAAPDTRSSGWAVAVLPAELGRCRAEAAQGTEGGGSCSRGFHGLCPAARITIFATFLIPSLPPCQQYWACLFAKHPQCFGHRNQRKTTNQNPNLRGLAE